jgi:hypothetical protein
MGCSRSPAPDAAAPAAAPRTQLGGLRSLAAPVGPGSGQPHLAVGDDGGVVLSWLEPRAADEYDEYALKYARLDGERWGAVAVVARGRDWVVSSADLPSVQPLTAQLWVADWRVAAADSPYAYGIRVAVSADAGASWSEPLALNDDTTPTEHGFVSWFLRDDGTAGAVWLDGRDLASDELFAASGAPLGTSLRYAFLSSDGRMLEQGVIDELACDCCRTDVAMTSSGALVIYRDRSAEEIRDIVVRRLTASQGWSEPVLLGPDLWEIEGCPVNGPVLDAQGRDVVAAWFTAAGDRPRVRFAASRDAGATFGAAVDVETDGAFGQAGVVLGRNGTAFVSSWRRGVSGGAELGVRTVSATGLMGGDLIVATTRSSRPDDVPQMVRSGQRLVFAWTETGAEPAVKVAYADLPDGA